MIGVIAALTLPTLMNSTNDKEIVARVKKAYATLKEAESRAIAKKYGPMDTWCNNLPSGVTCTVRMGKRLAEFMQVEKSCEPGETGCFSTSFKALDGTSIPFSSSAYSFILSDGSAIGLINSTSTAAFLIVDIDGPKKGKNTLGIDDFTFRSNISTGQGLSKTDISSVQNIKTSCATASYYLQGICAAWILTYDNADYLHTDSSGKCQNGVVLGGETNTSCN